MDVQWRIPQMIFGGNIATFNKTVFSGESKE
jgi:hypothetical protein